MCPPIEIPGTAKVNARLTRINTIACPISEPVARYSRIEQRADEAEDRAGRADRDGEARS